MIKPTWKKLICIAFLVTMQSRSGHNDPTTTTVRTTNGVTTQPTNSPGSTTSSTKNHEFSTTTWRITIHPATIADWEEQDKRDMITGLGMGAGIMSGVIILGIVVICLFCKVKVDRHQRYLAKVSEAKKKIEQRARREKRRQRAPGISNDLVTGYAGGMRNTWDPFNF